MKKFLLSFFIITNIFNNTIPVNGQTLTFVKDIRVTHNVDGYKPYIINCSHEDFITLTQIIEAEAGIETLKGKIAVGNIIINRVLDERFPNSITEVVYQKNQFSPVINGSINNIPSEESIKAAQLVLQGETLAETQGAIYFWADYVNKNNWIWTREITGKIGTHYFGK